VKGGGTKSAPRTVEDHLNAIFGKVDLRSRRDLVSRGAHP